MASESAADVCRQLYPRLVGALGLMCGDASKAEDLAQEALVRLWTRWPTKRRPENPMAWCYQVGVNLARSAARRRAVEQRILRRVGADPPVRDHADALADALRIRAAISVLPTRQRQAVVARHYLRLSVEETALVMGCAPGTVTALTHQAITSLRRSKVLSAEATYEEAGHGSQ